MTLPYPHGNAAGEIANNASYDTGFTPGSTGGKFIGFGEEGTSMIANRAHWALSANIDYLYQKMAADRSLPAGVAFTSTGQQKYHFTADVFTGDATYPGVAGTSDMEGLFMLFSVLDDQYNELTDGSDNEVRIRRVRETTEVTDVYKTGFVTDPWVYFCTVHPSTGAIVADPYTIPLGTDVRILYGERGSLEGLTTDAFTRFKVQAAGEVEAGAFLQDGSKKMTGDADWDGHKLLNLNEARGEAAADLLVRSQQELQLQGDTTLTLKDQFLSSPVSLSETGITGVEGIWPSLVGSLNSHRASLVGIGGNRFLDVGTPITFTDGTAAVAWPTSVLMHNGDRRNLPSGNVTAPTGAGTRVLVVDVAGATQQRQIADVVPTDAILAVYSHAGGVFTIKYDARWVMNKRADALEIAVGADTNGDLLPGCDFADLATAFDLVSALRLTTVGAHRPAVIRVRGQTSVTGSLVLPHGLVLIGEGQPTVLVSHGSSINTFDGTTTTPKVEVYNINFKWDNGAATQDVDKALFYNLGTYSVIRGCQVWSHVSANSFANMFFWDTTNNYRVVVDQCYAEVSTRFVCASGLVTLPAYNFLMDSVFRLCVAKNNYPSASTAFAFDVAGDGNLVEKCTVSSSGNLYKSGIRIGHRGRAIGNDITGTGNSLLDGSGVLVQTNTIEVVCSATVKDNKIKDMQYGVGCSIQATVAIPKTAMVAFQDNYAETVRIGVWVDNDPTNTLDGSSFKISGNTVDGVLVATGTGIFVKRARYALIEKNSILNNSGLYGIWVADDSITKIRENNVTGHTGTSSRAVLVTAAAGAALIQGNHLYSDGGSDATGIVVEVLSAYSHVKDNYIDGATGGTNFGIGVEIDAADCKVTGNTITNYTTYGVMGTASAADLLIDGNTCTDDASAYGWEIYVSGERTIVGRNKLSGTNAGISMSGTGSVAHHNALHVNGRIAGAAAHYSILVNTGADDSVVDGNILDACGDLEVQHYYHIRANARASIVNNVLKECYNYEFASSGINNYFIAAHAACLIQGNKIYNDVSSTMGSCAYGIFVGASGEYTQILGNQIYWTGSGSQDVAWGIYAGSISKVMASGNLVTGFYLGGAATYGAIRMDGNNCVAVGNLAGFLAGDPTGLQITLSNAGANYSMAVGNVVLSTGAFIHGVGVMPVSTNYNTTALAPIDDLNRSV